MSNNKQPKIVVIGGGTGSYTVLQAIKTLDADVSAIVSMVDNGGSTGALRDQYGVLPSGDVRQCILALSNSNKAMRELFSYRFGEGDLGGHSFGNLLLAALEKTSDNYDTAVMKACKILNVAGTVIPATIDDTHLVLTDGDREVVGEHSIENTILKSNELPQLCLRPKAKINLRAKQAIEQADLIVFAPGSLYESIIAVLLVDGVTKAIKKSNARLVQLVNLVTKPGQTDNWTVQDFANELERFLAGNRLDYVIYNTATPTAGMLKQYTRDNEFPVKLGKYSSDLTAKLVGRNLISVYNKPVDKNDALAVERSLIRHDAQELFGVIKELVA